MLRILLAAAAVLSLSACAAGTARPNVAAAPQPAATVGYLPAGAVDGRSILSPPPAAGSPHEQADRATYDETRALQGSPRWALAVQDNDLWRGGALKRFSCTLGVGIDQAKTPATFRLLRRTAFDVRDIGNVAKNHFARTRPAIGNDKPICVSRKGLDANASYPSGHAMIGWAWALILAEAAPQKADALLALGREAGDSRVVCGVHYPSDVEAGRTLAAGMVARLHADPAFMADLAALKQEIAGAAPANCPA